MRARGQLFGVHDERHLVEALQQFIFSRVDRVFFIIRIVIIVLIDLGDESQILRMLQIEQNVDRSLAAPHMHWRAPQDGR
ncbi:hypothetical protein D3C87_1980210 [compost metagenome]